ALFAAGGRRVAAQSDSGQAAELILEEVYGEYALWIHDPESETWSVLPLPDDVNRTKLAEAALVVIGEWPTLVGESGEPVLLYDQGTLHPVRDQRVRLQDGRWLSWNEGHWRMAGPPA